MEKGNLQYNEGTYINREFKKKGENSYGTYKVFKVTFEIDGIKQNFWAFDKTKGFDTLEEGEEFTIGYTEQESNGYTMKSAKFFGPPRDKDKREAKKEKKSEPKPEPKKEEPKKEEYKPVSDRVDDLGLTYEENVTRGQAVNLAFMKMINEKGYDGNIDSDKFAESVMRDYYPLIRKVREYHARIKKQASGGEKQSDLEPDIEEMNI